MGVRRPDPGHPTGEISFTNGSKRPTSANNQNWETLMSFLAESVRHPARTGAPVASSRSCVRAVLDGLELQSVRQVVELGAGTGALTESIRRRIPPTAGLLALEISPSLSTELQRRCPSDNVEVVCDSARNLTDVLAQRGIATADYVISTLPWTLLDDHDQRAILQSISGVLHVAGAFTTLLSAHQAWTPTGKKFDATLHEYFPHVRQGPVSLLNLPPLRAYHCRPIDT